MMSLLPTCAFARDIPDMVQAKRLAPLTWEPVQVNVDLAGLVTTHQSGEVDFSEDALSSQIVRDEITKAIVQEVVERIGSRPTLLFAASVEHAQQFAKLFCQRGISARAVSGATSQSARELVYTEWRGGALQMVCNCSLLTEGFDFPEIAALVMARPTLSPNLYIQMLGRGTRMAPGKEDCLVLDVVGNQPDTSGQVTLPQILGERWAPHGSSTTETPDSAPKQKDAVVTTLLKAVLGKDGKTNCSLLDPIGQSHYSWVAYQHGRYEGYFALMDQWEATIIERDLAGSGLYRSRLYLMPPGKPGETRWIEANYLPLRQQVAVIHQEMDERYNTRLGSRNAAWRERPATLKQREALCRMYPGRMDQITEALTQGEASDMITHFKLRRTLVHPPEPEGAATE